MAKVINPVFEVGSFSGALSPETDNFRYFPEFVENNLDPEKKPEGSNVLYRGHQV